MVTITFKLVLPRLTVALAFIALNVLNLNEGFGPSRSDLGLSMKCSKLPESAKKQLNSKPSTKDGLALKAPFLKLFGRQSRYLGLAKTHLQHLAIGTTINLTRVVTWWMAGQAKSPLYRSPFAKLAPVT